MKKDNKFIKNVLSAGLAALLGLGVSGCSIKTVPDYSNPVNSNVRIAYFSKLDSERNKEYILNICNSKKMIEKYSENENLKGMKKIHNKNPHLERCINDFSKFLKTKIGAVEYALDFSKNHPEFNSGIPVYTWYSSKKVSPKIKYKKILELAKNIPYQKLTADLNAIRTYQGLSKLQNNRYSAAEYDIGALAFDTLVLTLGTHSSVKSISNSTKKVTVGPGSSSGIGWVPIK